MTIDAPNIDYRDSTGNPVKIRTNRSGILHSAPAPSEAQIQREIVDYLDAVLLKSYRIFAVPNSSRRTKSGKATNAVAGLRAGVTDLILLGPDGRAYSIEVKRPGGLLSPAQEEWASWLFSNNSPIAVVYSLDDVINALVAWQIPTRQAK